MRTVIVKTPGEVDVIDVARPNVGPYQALVKTEVACLCNATDGKLVNGHFPGVEAYPLALGHESAGTVADVGNKVRNFRVGDTAIGGLVFDFGDELNSGWGGFCEYTLINDHDAMVEDNVADEEHGWFECYEIQRTVPAGISMEDAVLLCTWREVYGAFGDFNLEAGQDILIFGAGPVGLSFVKFAQLKGLSRITVVDPLEHKRARALQMGANAAVSPEELGQDSFQQDNKGRFDRIIDAVGNEKIINAALPLIRMGGSICVYGVLAQKSLTLQHATGPYNFNLLMHQWPTRQREHAAQKPLCDWILEGRLKAEDFLTHEFSVEQIHDALAAVKSGEVVKVLLRY